jgi:uncharacterized lipoprotein
MRSTTSMFFLATALLAGCSTQAWYEGVRRGAENDCNRQAPGAAEQCRAGVTTKNYDAYEKERAAQKP